MSTDRAIASELSISSSFKLNVMAWVCGVCGQRADLGLYTQIQIGQGLSASPPRFLHKITLLVSHAPSTLPVAMDDNREIRAMILCSLPYPPLPVEARHFEDGNRLGETAVTTSHDILSHLLEVACVYKDAHADAERKSRQMEVFRCFLMDIVQNGMVDTEKLYSIYCKRCRNCFHFVFFLHFCRFNLPALDTIRDGLAFTMGCNPPMLFWPAGID